MLKASADIHELPGAAPTIRMTGSGHEPPGCGHHQPIRHEFRPGLWGNLVTGNGEATEGCYTAEQPVDLKRF